MDKRTTNRRLLKMAKLLEKNARNKKGLKFDLNDWGTVKKMDAPVSCGTTACAMGLAALSGEFKRQGLSYETWTGWSLAEHNLIIKFDERQGVGAAEKLFGISWEAANFFFTPEHTPDSMKTGAKGELFLVKRIKHFVKTGELA